MKATCKEDFLEKAVIKSPRDAALHFPSLLAFAEWRYKTRLEPYMSPPLDINWEDYPIVEEWVSKYIKNPYEGRPKSLILYGPTRTGKTLFVRSLDDHAYFPGLFMLEGFEPDKVKYAVFDDIIRGLEGIPDFKLWLGGQEEFVVGDKYMRKQRIKWGKPTIFVQNTDPRHSCTEETATWLEGNCVFAKVDKDICRVIKEKKATDNADQIGEDMVEIEESESIDATLQ